MYIYIEREREKERFIIRELVHTIMETEKSRDLPSASWRPGKASGVVSVQVQEVTHISARKQADRVNSPLLHIREGNLLYLVSQFKCKSHQETPSQTRPDI